MKYINKNISSDGTVTLVAKKGQAGLYGGRLSSVQISNHDNSSGNIINLFLHDGTNTYVLLETIIPSRCALYLSGGEITYDGDKYDLKITTEDSGGTTNMTVIIK